LKNLVALSAIGKDRPGIVAALSKALFESGCNLENSSMTRLRGDFAILLMVALPPKLALASLEKRLRKIGKKWGLTLALRKLSPSEAKTSSAPSSRPYTIMVYGADHPGIVYRVAQAAADHRVNITDLQTHVTGPSQKPLYTLAMEASVPQKSSKAFNHRLQELGKKLKVEIRLNPVEAEEL